MRFAELVRSERERDSGEQRAERGRGREIERERAGATCGIEKID